MVSGGENQKKTGENVQCGCPLAPYSDIHWGPFDDKMTMGILVRPNDTCWVNCFVCGYKAHSLTSLVETLAGHDTRFLPLVKRAAEIENVDLLDLLDACNIYTLAPVEVAPKYPIYPESHIAEYKKLFHPYLESRGINKNVGRAWEIGYDETKQRIVLPVRDTKAQLVGAVGRSVHPNLSPKYINYWDFPRGQFILGAQLADPRKRTVVVEGALDAPVAWAALGTLRSEYNVVSTMGSQVTKAQLDQIVEVSSEVVFAFDNDSAGDTASNYCHRALAGRIITRRVSWPEGSDDPASVGAAFKDIVDNAEMIF